MGTAEQRNNARGGEVLAGYLLSLLPLDKLAALLQRPAFLCPPALGVLAYGAVPSFEYMVLAGAHVCIGSALPTELSLHPWALPFACSASHLLMCLLLQFLGPLPQKTKQSILSVSCSRQGLCQEPHGPCFCRAGQPSYCYNGHLYT